MSNQSEKRQNTQFRGETTAVDHTDQVKHDNLRVPFSIGLVVVGLLFIPAQGFGQVAVNDTTGWTTWVLPDVQADQQTGSGYDDLVGDGSTPMMQQKTGMLNGEDVVLFRVRLRVFSSENDWANGGNLGLGMDLDGDNALDLIGMFEQDSNANQAGSTYFRWGTPGTDSNTSPSTTDYTNQAASEVTLTGYDGSNASTATFWYSATTDTVDFGGEAGGVGSDAWMTFAVSYANFNTGISTYASDAFDFDGVNSGFTFDSSTQIGYVLFTSQQSNAFNQDIGGVDGYNAAITFESMGAFVTVSADGSPAPVPEPSTFAQLGGMLMAGLVLQLRRRRRETSPESLATE